MEPVEPPKYRDALRQVGAYLDSRVAEAFTLVEVPDGFELAIDTDGGRKRELVRLSREQLEQGRDPKRRNGDTADSLWKNLGTTGAEFLEAVGIELEGKAAHNILLDRLADGLLLSYSFLDPLRGYAWGKSVAILSPNEMRQILDIGREEIRRTRKRWIF